MDALGLSSFWVKIIYIFSFSLGLIELVLALVKKDNYKKRIVSALFYPYLLIVLSLTLLDRVPSSDYRYLLKLFWSYDSYNREYWVMGREVVCNIIMLFPFGFLFPLLMRESGKEKLTRYTILFSFLFTLLIEVTQLITKRGFFEFDDIYHNTMGAVAGYYFYLFFDYLFPKD